MSRRETMVWIELLPVRRNLLETSFLGTSRTLVVEFLLNNEASLSSLLSQECLLSSDLGMRVGQFRRGLGSGDIMGRVVLEDSDSFVKEARLLVT